MGTAKQPAARAAAAVGKDYGKSLRAACPRDSHSAVTATRKTAKGERDIVAMVEATNEGRVEHLVPIRHARMSLSPFAFYRGTAFIQAHDLVGTPVTGITVQACGDCHLSNFGGFATPERNLIFDVNDFDESFPGPWEWDIKRLAASFVLAGRERKFTRREIRAAVHACLDGYRKAIRGFAALPVLDTWHARIDWSDLTDMARRDKAAKKLIKGYGRKAKERTSEHVFVKIAAEINGSARIIDQPPFLYHPDPREADIRAEAGAFLAQYRATLRDDMRALFDRFSFIDAAVKVVGVGSVGTRCLIALMMDPQNAPLFLQIKESGRSVLDSRTGISQPWDNQGERVVSGQRLTQAASDPFLGWAKSSDGKDFYVRQLRDMKIGVEVADLTAPLLERYGALCGRALARAHAKTGDAAAIAGYLGGGGDFNDAIHVYATLYADQVERDHATFVKAIAAGRLAVDKTQSA